MAVARKTAQFYDTHPRRNAWDNWENIPSTTFMHAVPDVAIAADVVAVQRIRARIVQDRIEEEVRCGSHGQQRRR